METQSAPGLIWYKSLTLEQRFGLREVSADICGMNWEDFNILFSPRERIEIIYKKLIIEGILNK